MRLGLAIADYTWPGSPLTTASLVRDIAATAEDAGFARIGVTDRLWQVPASGSSGREMLEAYTTLGYLAAATTRVELLALVTPAVYREPALLAKIISTLDVLSGGGAILGIGAGASVNDDEAHGPGLPGPPASERFERLEETLRICLQMWSDDDGPYTGQHYRLGRTVNSPQTIRRPRPPILIGGAGPRKTLRLVAKYGDACNLFATPDLPRKLDLLRMHCQDIGRDYDEIEKTVVFPLDPGPGGRGIDALLTQLRRFAELGIDSVYGPVPHAEELTPLHLLGKDIIPAVDEL